LYSTDRRVRSAHESKSLGTRRARPEPGGATEFRQGGVQYNRRIAALRRGATHLHRSRSLTRARKEPIIGKQRTTFNKQARERANKAKAAAKRERRQDRAAEKADAESDDTPRESSAELMQALQDLHASYDAKQLTLEDFEEQRDDLVIRLSNAIA